jgi:hypothetical protein
MIPLLVPERQAWDINDIKKLKMIKCSQIDTLQPGSP